MKKIIFIAIMATIAGISVFTACNKDAQSTTKPAKINPLKNIKEGTTYTFYGQTEQNLANEEICQMQLTMGKNGEWTVKRQVIPNRMFKSAVDIIQFGTLFVPEQYITHNDEHSITYTFPEGEDVGYYFVPFDEMYKKETAVPQKTYTYFCMCLSNSAPTATLVSTGFCRKVDEGTGSGFKSYHCDNISCTKEGGYCTQGRSETLTFVNPGRSTPSPSTQLSPGLLLPATSMP